MTPITVDLEDGTTIKLKYGWIAICRAEAMAGKPMHRILSDWGAIETAAMLITGCHDSRFKTLEEMAQVLDLEKWEYYGEQIARALKRDHGTGSIAKVLPFTIVKGGNDGDSRG